MRLPGKVAVVTGGGRGIGKEIAGSLAREGAEVVICSRTADDLRETASAIAVRGGRCTFRVVDVADEGQVDALVRDVVVRHGRLDILVNNAGVGVYKPLTDSTSGDWERVMNTNLRGAFYFTRAAAGVMIKQRSGVIVNVASGAGKKGFANLSVYCASKSGLLGLTDSAGKELKQYGITVSAVTPGYTRTDFFKGFPDSFRLPAGAKEPRDVARQVLKKILDSQGFVLWRILRLST